MFFFKKKININSEKMIYLKYKLNCFIINESIIKK